MLATLALIYATGFAVTLARRAWVDLDNARHHPERGPADAPADFIRALLWPLYLAKPW